MNILTIGLIAATVVTIVLILLQDRSSGTGGAFGGSEAGGFYQRRRGIEKTLFALTIVSITAFSALIIVNLANRGSAPLPTVSTDGIKVEADAPGVTVTPVAPEN